MSKDGKNRLKNNLWLRQGALVGLLVLWILAIYFKKAISEPLKFGVLFGLVILTVLVLYWLNRAFFGLGREKHKDDEK